MVFGGDFRRFEEVRLIGFWGVRDESDFRGSIISKRLIVFLLREERRRFFRDEGLGFGVILVVFSFSV